MECIEVQRNEREDRIDRLYVSTTIRSEQFKRTTAVTDRKVNRETNSRQKISSRHSQQKPKERKKEKREGRLYQLIHIQINPIILNETSN